MRNTLVALCILALLAMIGWKVSEPWREKRKQKAERFETSDAATIEHTLTFCGDEWLGYLIFRSPQFRRQLEQKKIAATFEIEPDFQKRFEMLESGDCDFVCATIDSFLVNGRSTNYPGVITFVIDESFGGDALLSREGIESLDDLKGENVEGAFVGYSPSEFLLKSQIAHFGLENLTPRLPDFRTDDATAAYQKFKDGKVDFAVLWEPLVSQALREVPSAQRLIDTSQARGIIYDVAIASRRRVAETPELVQAVTDAYFESLRHYSSDPAAFKKLATEDSGESSDNAEAMLSGVRFVGLAENREMATGGSAVRLTDAVSAITDILVDVGELDRDPLNGNPRVVMNSQFLSQSAAAAAPSTATASRQFFRTLDEIGWELLDQNRTGTLLEEPITFGVGQSTIPEEFQAELRDAAQKLTHYPNHRLIVQAHVSPGSNPEADLQLSQERADAIRDFLIADLNLSAPRIRAIGIGGSEPVVQNPGESSRAWKRRCRRARIYLAEDT
ncbi:MAG: phosphate ABC transporter substrate-binding/OmpA family protein [Verrucomicrobiota bacterium]